MQSATACALRLEMQFATATFRMSPSPTPMRKACAQEPRTQSEIVMFSHARVLSFMSRVQARIAMASSAVSIVHPLIVTLRLQSMSMPSVFAIVRSLRTR